VREGIRKGNKDSGNKDSGNKDSGNEDSGNEDSGIADPGKQEWTMTHAFYADMGVFMLCVKQCVKELLMLLTLLMNIHE
jgi:hypothetical protein